MSQRDAHKVLYSALQNLLKTELDTVQLQNLQQLFNILFFETKTADCYNYEEEIDYP
jgi:hypothetical protein